MIIITLYVECTPLRIAHGNSYFALINRAIIGDLIVKRYKKLIIYFNKKLKTNN